MLSGLLGEPAPSRPRRARSSRSTCCLQRLPRVPGVSSEEAFTGTFHVNEGYEQLAARVPGGERRVDPERAAVRGLLPLADRPEHPVGRAARRRGPDADAVRAAHAGAAVHATPPPSSAPSTPRSARSNSVLAEPIESCLLGLEALTPPEIEAELGMPGGHIFHRDLAWPFAESDEEVGTWGVETAHANVWLCGAGARRGGGVSGIPGHNAARAVLGPAIRYRCGSDPDPRIGRPTSRRIPAQHQNTITARPRSPPASITRCASAACSGGNSCATRSWSRPSDASRRSSSSQSVRSSDRRDHHRVHADPAILDLVAVPAAHDHDLAAVLDRRERRAAEQRRVVERRRRRRARARARRR